MSVRRPAAATTGRPGGATVRGGPAPAGRARVDRVRTRAAFRELSARGRKGRAGVLRVAFVPGGERPAVAYAVGRAVGPAVVRNRVRRRLRAAVAELAPAPGTYLVAAAPAAADRPYAALRADLAAALAAVDALPREAPR